MFNWNHFIAITQKKKAFPIEWHALSSLHQSSLAILQPTTPINKSDVSIQPTAAAAAEST